MAGGGAACAVPVRAELRTRAAIDDQRATSRGQLEGQSRGMGIGRGLALRRSRCVDDQRAAPALHPHETHRDRLAPDAEDTGCRKRRVEPPFGPASATVKSRQRTIGMAQRAQGRRDPRDRIEDRTGRRASCRLQRLRRPVQQRQNLQQFLGVSGRDPALGVDLRRAIARQGLQRGVGMALHPGQRETRVDKPGQRLKPGQPAGRARPAFRQEDRLLPQRAEEPVRILALASVQQQDCMVNPADQAAARQIGRPARPAAVAEAVDPAEDPVLCAQARLAGAQRRKVVEPAAALQRILESRAGYRQIPDIDPGAFDQRARKQEIALNELPPLGVRADRARLGLADESGCSLRTACARSSKAVQRRAEFCR